MNNEILIIDDCKLTAKVLSGFMRELGFEAHTAYSAEEAVAFLKDHAPPGLLLVDWVLPGMSGVELVAHLKSRAETSEIPVVMVTGERDMSRIVEALKNGADEYIMKPFTKEVIEEKLRLIGIQVSSQHR